MKSQNVWLFLEFKNITYTLHPVSGLLSGVCGYGFEDSRTATGQQ